MFNLHENLPESDSREHLDEVEIPDIDLTNYENASLGFILNSVIKGDIPDETENYNKK